MSKATEKMYTSDGAGREEVTAAVEDEINRRLEAKGILPNNTDEVEYDQLWREELIALEEEVEDDYGERLADDYDAACEDRDFWANEPGGEADYMYG